MTTRLTPIETQILRGLLAGKTCEQLAAERYRSPKTIRTQLSMLRRKAGVTNNTQLGCWAAREGVAP